MTKGAHRLPIVWHPTYEVDIGAHVFPTRKYRLIADRLLADGTITEEQIHRPGPVSDADVSLAHRPEYIRQIHTDDFTAMERARLEVPFSRELATAMWLCAGGTTLTAQLACEVGIAVHLGGGFHHAFPDHGEGFCLINDVAVAAAMRRRSGEARRIVVIDLDVHHGNGTAAIFVEDPDVFTFSMHQTHNYPAVKPPSDLDIGLEDGTGDEAYLQLLSEALDGILTPKRFDLALYLAGADPYGQDQLGGLDLTIEGLARRDALVFASARAAGVPVAVTLAGGYAVNPDHTVEIHCNTVRAAVASLNA